MIDDNNTDFRMWADRLASEHVTITAGSPDIALANLHVFYNVDGEDVKVQTLSLRRSDLSVNPHSFCCWEFAD